MTQRNKIIVVVLILITLGLWGLQKSTRTKAPKDNVTVSQVEAKSYWTCPMHPQVHQDHPGECPICHMKLVKVSTQTQEQKSTDSETKKNLVQVTTSQLQLLGIQKTTVEKMDLKPVIPFSGRVLSSSSVAFQLYEQDLRYVRSGLKFKGEGNIAPDEEISGTISSVDSIVDPTSRTVRIVGQISKGPRGLISETSFRGEIELDLKDRIAIPESSVLHTGSGSVVYVFSESGNSLTPRAIKLGLKSEGFYEVLSGLSGGEIISSGPNFLIDSEAKIRGAND